MRPIQTSLCCLFLLAVCSSPAADIQTHLFDPVDVKRKRTVPVKVYLSESKGERPVVLFSHGLGGSRDNNAYLGNHWAKSGYVCVFMQHTGSDSSVWKKAERANRLTALKNAAGLQATLNRLNDVKFVIDQLEKWADSKGHPLAGNMDLRHIGMCGHSYGAVTTLGVMGRKYSFNRSFGDPRIDAFMPMSPQPGKRPSPEKSFGHIKAPVLCMTGTKDGSPIDPRLKPDTRQQVYAAMPKGDKYQLVFEGGEHFAFGDSGGFRTRGRNPKHHPAIQEISTRFWNAYLKGDLAAKKWLQSAAPRKACDLHSKDVWEWK